MTKRKQWLTEFLNKLGLVVVHYETQTSSKSHIKMTVVPAWNPKPQTLVVYIDPGYRINFKFSQYLDNSFRTEAECIVASLLMNAAQEYCGSDVDMEWVPYRKCSKHRAHGTPEPRTDYCYLRLRCSYLPWKEKPVNLIKWHSRTN